MALSSADHFDSSQLEADDLGGSRFVVGCAHREVNDRNDHYDGLALLPVDDQQQMRFDEGLDFESEVFDELSRLHGVSSMRLFDDVDEATAAAMARGDRLIIGASLPVVHHRGGRPDALVRFGDHKLANGKWAYLPVDVKNSKPLEGSAKAKQWPVSTMAEPWFDVAAPTDLGTGKPKTDHGLQLAHYWLLLDDLGHAPDIDAVGGTINPDSDGGYLGITWRSLDDGKDSLLDIARREWRERWAAVLAMRNGEPPHTRPVYREECKTCRWHDVCESELVAEQHVSLLQGVGVVAVRKLAEGGVETIPQLAALDPVNLESNPVPQYSQLAAHIDTARVFLRDDGRPYMKRDSAPVVVPRADVEIDFDIENDDIVYMYGCWISERTPDGHWTDGEYLSFHSYDRTDPQVEARLLADFWTWLHHTVERVEGEGRTIAVYCYSGGFAEIPRMKEASIRANGAPHVPTVDQIGALVSHDWWVDMHDLAKRFHWPTRRLGLKDLAPLSGFEWDADDAGGANSILWYRIACDPDHPEHQAMADKLLRYNADDVRATLALRRWLDDGLSGRGWRVESVESLNQN
ncbi:MAG: TM0106 family RecB-like putative nuclease [Ilumatobacteraceae bacterium]